MHDTFWREAGSAMRSKPCQLPKPRIWVLTFPKRATRLYPSEKVSCIKPVVGEGWGEGVLRLVGRNRSQPELAIARLVVGPVHDRLVTEHVSVSYLEVEATVGAAANPSLVVNGSALASKVRQGQQHALYTLQAFRPFVVPFPHVFLLRNRWPGIESAQSIQRSHIVYKHSAARIFGEKMPPISHREMPPTDSFPLTQSGCSPRLAHDRKSRGGHHIDG